MSPTALLLANGGEVPIRVMRAAAGLGNWTPTDRLIAGIGRVDGGVFDESRSRCRAGGSFRAPFFKVSWQTAGFGGMGLEGAVKLGFRRELAAIDGPEEHKALYEGKVKKAYEAGKAVNTAAYFEFDDLIDPLESRQRISSALGSVPAPAQRTGKKRPHVDTW